MMISIEQKAAIDYIRNESHGATPVVCPEVTVNFHPDRITSSGAALLDEIRLNKILKSQFETGTSNGGLSAYVGGNRWLWEQHAFGGAYDECSASQRPKYGALNYQRLLTGASPRFGSSFFRIKPRVLERTTFCFPDSHLKPVDFSTYNGVGRLIDLAKASSFDSLDSYVEAHIHGPVVLDIDVESLVLDPSYRDTAVEQQADKLPVDIEWHSGFKLDVRKVKDNPDYRGESCVNLANKLARDGLLTPRILGDAINASLWDSNELKKLWHYVAKFGYCGQT